jgi:hypothetical protein
MLRFNEIRYDPDSQTVAVGAGLLWDDVYAALEPFGVNVVGGRVSGVGVAGFTLGGGKSNSLGIAYPERFYSAIERVFMEDQPIWVDCRQRCSLRIGLTLWLNNDGVGVLRT